MLPAPRVSVLLPVFNGAATLQRAIDSVRAQTFTEWELLVIDDGSGDATPEIAAAAHRADRRIIVLGESHRGLVAALNHGLRHARGEFVARLDADDECRPARLERQVAVLEAAPTIGVCATQVAFGGDATAQRGYALHVAWTNTLCSHDAIARARFIDAPLAHPSVMFRRELVGAHGGYRDHAWPEDYELWLRWIEAGVRFTKVPEPLVVWNDPPGRLSRTHPRYAPDAFYDCKCHFLARWLTSGGAAAGRPVFLWGAGRPTRRRFAKLADGGVTLAGYIDVDAKKIGGRADGKPVLAPDTLPPPEKAFVIAGVASRGARELIGAELAARGFTEGLDWIAAA